MKVLCDALIALVTLAGVLAAQGPAPTVAAVSLGAQEPSRPRAASVAAVLARVQARLGATPSECGRHPLPVSTPPPDSYAEALIASVRCVIEAAALRRPSWMFVQERGIDSWVGTGLLSGADGVVQQFYYDSDATGGGNSVSTLDTRACAAPTVIRRNGYAVLECDATTGVR